MERVAALLESDSFDSVEDLAWAVLREVFAIVAERGWYAVWAKRYPDVLWGPYSTAADAESAWNGDIARTIGDAGGVVVRIAPWSTDDGTDPNAVTPRTVCSCGHPNYRHTTEGKRLWCGSKKGGCTCRGFTPANAAP